MGGGSKEGTNAAAAALEGATAAHDHGEVAVWWCCS